MHNQDIEIDQRYLTSNARNALVNLVKDKYKKDGEKKGYVDWKDIKVIGE